MDRSSPIPTLLAAYVVLSVLYAFGVISTGFLVWWTFSMATLGLIGGVINEQRISRLYSPENNHND